MSHLTANHALTNFKSFSNINEKKKGFLGLMSPRHTQSIGRTEIWLDVGLLKWLDYIALLIVVEDIFSRRYKGTSWRGFEN